ncbi:hypothetical protein Ocin01_08718 [Orchesella cincta]|uniref:Uncharacterized protein n=1 Tax=Orchesella cincta TaxID=48709 RepID=A0A1D2MY83_ORCCI|nr:hypothetical protein Ocin01_08718 [Orchesella cincta]
MAQYSVIITVFVVTVFIAHSLCFRIDEPSLSEPEQKPQPRQVADNVLVIQDEVAPTTRAPLPQRIREGVLNGLRDFQNNVRQVPVRVTTCFQNITKCAQTILRRNQTGNAATSLFGDEE